MHAHIPTLLVLERGIINIIFHIQREKKMLSLTEEIIVKIILQDLLDKLHRFYMREKGGNVEAGLFQHQQKKRKSERQKFT